MVTKFTVFGSCACRDIFYSEINKDYKQYFEIGEDGIRISLISLMSNEIDYNPESLEIYPKNEENIHYTNWIKKDFDKSFLNVLKEDDFEYLMIDTYYDVNFGVLDLGDGRYITNNLGLEQTDFFKNLKNYNKLTIFDNFEKYYNLWVHYCDLFFNFLKINCPSIKVILNTNRHVFKVLKEDGSICESDTFKSHCNQYNYFRDVLDKYILSNYDVDVLNFNENTLIDGNHRWGSFSLHYVKSYYDDMTNQLNDIIKRDSLKNSVDYDFNGEVRYNKRKNQLYKINSNLKYQQMNKEINTLTRKLDAKNRIINNLPQLSNTNVGATTLDGKITYRNWWPSKTSEFDGFLEEQWFTQYLKHHFPDADYKINLFSVFGNTFRFDENMDGKKVFYSPEQLNQRLWHINRDYGRCALDTVDFSMAFDRLDHSNYLRFPYWVHYLFRPWSSEESIIETYNYMRSVEFEKTKDITLVASHDLWGARTKITKTFEDWVDIEYAGAWRNNTSDLWDNFGNNKVEYLKQFKFNICSENIEDDAYVTEKIFDAARSDCIPIYAGGGNYLEPNVLNRDAILLWDLHNDDKEMLIEDNLDTIEQFKNLREDEKSYLEFKEKDLLVEDGYKFVIKIFKDLEKHFERIIYD